MIVLGVDPGTAIVGYSVIEYVKSKYRILDYGCVYTDKDEDMPVRLEKIYDGLDGIIKIWKPQDMAIEELFFFKNQKTVAQVYEARGVILFTLIERGLKILEPTITQIKKGVTGSGTADKKQVKEAIKLILGLKELKGHDDSWDAVAAGFVGLAMFR